jgi:hypothetical protein
VISGVKVLAGSVAPEEGLEVEIDGHWWRVVDAVVAPAHNLVRVMLEQAD